ncbi:MAG: hypothetical protein IJE68_00930 [Clostridia bacterium]|nr:hypothetical protein [Clostridia bacterium]
MNKKHVLMTIAIFAVSLVFGCVFNFVLQGENPSIVFSIIRGFFIGILTSIFYIILSVFMGLGVVEEYFGQSAKFLITMVNVLGFIAIWVGITGFITQTTLDNVWMQIVIILFSIAVVVKANQDRKDLRSTEKNN